MAIERVVAHAVDSRRSKFALPKPHLEAVQLDILYALARHARWVRVPLFKDVLVDFLVTEHDLPRGISSEVVTDVLDSCESLLGDDPEFRSMDLLQGKVDEEFLTYIFVSAASSDHESGIREQLGLGAGLLRSLKSAADVLSKPELREGADAPRLFLPDVDTVFARIMIKLTASVRTCPWVLDVYRLKYLLLDKLDRQRFNALSGDIAGIFDFLCAMGSAGQPIASGVSAGTGRLDESSLESLMKSAVRRINLETPAFLSLLEAADLIYRSDVRRRGKRQEVIWDLTEQAESLTAAAFVATLQKELISSSSKPTGESDRNSDSALVSLIARNAWRKLYLKKIVRGLNLTSMRQLLTMLTPQPRDHFLAECLLIAALEANATDLAEELFFRFQEPGYTPTALSSACRVAGAMRARPSVRNRLQSLASDHPSLTVRSAALEALL